MSANSRQDDVNREEFYFKISEVLQCKRAPNTFLLTREKYATLLEQVKAAKTAIKKTPADYRRIKRYEVINTLEGERLFSVATPDKEDRQMFVTLDEMYDIIKEYHLKLNHGGRSRMMVALKPKYKNITAESVLVYLSLCYTCKNKLVKRERKPNKVEDKSEETFNETNNDSEECDLNDPFATESDLDNVTEARAEEDNDIKKYPEQYSRGQVDILDVTTKQNEEYKYIMVYRNFVTKFIHLKPLKSVNIEDTVDALLDIFLVFGAPNILQSKNGIALCKPICRKISTVYPDMKIVAGTAVISKNDFRGKSNEDILKKLCEWLEKNRNMKWQYGVKFVQHYLNTTFDKDICRTPSEAVFGEIAKKGLGSFMTKEDYENLNTEKELKIFLEQRESNGDSSKQLILDESLIIPSNFIKMEIDPTENDDDND